MWQDEDEEGSLESPSVSFLPTPRNLNSAGWHIGLKKKGSKAVLLVSLGKDQDSQQEVSSKPLQSLPGLTLLGHLSTLLGGSSRLQQILAEGQEEEMPPGLAPQE